MDPIIFSLGPIAIRYYSLAYILGALAIYATFWYLIRKKHITWMDEKQLDSFLFWVIIAVVAGGRLGYFLFYDISTFWINPLEVLMVWHGGMSFHGGLLGAIVVFLIFGKKHKIPFYKLGDIAVVPVALGLCLGRIANFINGELVGTPTSVPWCIVFPNVDDICRHPSQLYESAKNLLLFLVTGYTLKKHIAKKVIDGTNVWLFVTGYGILRFIVTFWRDDPNVIGTLSTGQILCLFMIIIGGTMLILKLQGKNVRIGKYKW